MTNEVFRNGHWQPSIPLPFYGPAWITCWECHKRFWGSAKSTSRAFRRYERHYQRRHQP